MKLPHRDRIPSTNLLAGTASSVRLLPSALLVLLLALPASAQPAAPVTTSPAGKYAVARLELSAGLQAVDEKGVPGPQQLLVALRDGKLVTL